MKTDRLLRCRTLTLEADERAMLESRIAEVKVFEARQTIIRRETPLDTSLYLVRGLMCRYIDDRKGHRQLVSIQIPGDFVDLHAYPLKYLDHDVGTLTQVEVAMIPHSELDDLVATRPELTRKLWFSTMLDAALHREWIFKLGRLPSHGRVAHFLCETEARLRAVGLSDGRSFELQLTQADLAEVCGLTSIHVNRVLRDLRERGLCGVRDGVVTFQDYTGLSRLGEFDSGYLYLDPIALEGEPRRRSSSDG